MRTAILVLALCISGCATQQQNSDVAYFNHWQQSSAEHAAAGRMKWSDYYRIAYDLAVKLPNNSQNAAIAQGAAYMVPIALRYEGGSITREDFAQEQRTVNLRIRERALQAQQAQDARSSQAMQDAAIMLLNRPAPPLPPPPTNINCTSRIVYNTVQTQCF